ncbi:MAG: hypothetical protein QE493_01310 [Verrucomicrobiae bacterium]|jgi:hypothetical protein|nr:hypothetical protein [Verrucomicrobiae bacterium]
MKLDINNSTNAASANRKPQIYSSAKNLVPKSPIGKELNERFQEQAFRSNPGESPMARALVAYGYTVVDYPLYPQYTDSDWLASQVSMSGLRIVFRQPTPHDLAVCFMKREEGPKMLSPLFGITEFFAFTRYECEGINYVGGNIDKNFNIKENKNNLKMENLITFYNRILGEIESYEHNGVFFIYAEVHRNSRFEKFPIWNRVRKRMIAQKQKKLLSIPQ